MVGTMIAGGVQGIWCNTSYCSAQGIGNCIQGFIDAILFVAFTPLIRQKLITAILCGRGILTSKQPNRFLKESKNYYDNHLKNYRPHPRYSLTSSSPITILPTRFSPSPEPSTSFYESPGSSFEVQVVYKVKNTPPAIIVSILWHNKNSKGIRSFCGHYE